MKFIKHNNWWAITHSKKHIGDFAQLADKSFVFSCSTYFDNLNFTSKNLREIADKLDEFNKNV